MNQKKLHYHATPIILTGILFIIMSVSLFGQRSNSSSYSEFLTSSVVSFKANRYGLISFKGNDALKDSTSAVMSQALSNLQHQEYNDLSNDALNNLGR